MFAEGEAPRRAVWSARGPDDRLGNKSSTDQPGPVAGSARLPGYALEWREAVEIAEAYRVRLRTAVLEEIDAGLPISEAAQLTGLSRVTMHHWLRNR